MTAVQIIGWAIVAFIVFALLACVCALAWACWCWVDSIEWRQR